MKSACTILFVFVASWVGAQKYDYHWILGLKYQSGTNGWGNTDVIFTDSTADTLGGQRYAYMDNSQTTISDSAGNLLFYSNGARIYTSLNDTMQNGDSLNFGTQWQENHGVFYPWLTDIMALPTDSQNIWNLIHYYVEINNNSDIRIYPWRVYQTRIDMSKNFGQGDVIFKNKTLIQDTFGTYVMACRHANGRDWWALVHKTSSNCLYELLVRSDTIINYGRQCIGDNYLSTDEGQAVFSPDGSKFAWIGNYSGVNLYDFDRCSGELGNPVHLPLYSGLDNTGTIVTQFGLSFSPNSRFLYAAQANIIVQFDTWATNIWASSDTVGYFQQSPDSGAAGYYFLMQLAPDGKIYVSAGNSIMYLHVIEQPDLKGETCNFLNYAFPLPYLNTFGLPSYPNYRLGPLIGSPCDTLYKTDTLLTLNPSPKERDLQIFPNPATGYTIVDYGFTDWSKGPVYLEITNAMGQIIYTQPLPMYSGFQKIEVSKFAAGIYTACIKRNNSVVASGKFVKE